MTEMRHHCAVFPKLGTQKSAVVKQNWTKIEWKIVQLNNQKEQSVSSLPNKQCWARYSKFFHLLLFTSYSF